jgi:hypothetical protein
MFQHRLLSLAFALPVCTGCTTLPEQTADVESYAPKVYRTGSNIPAKDYAAEHIELSAPDVINPANRPSRCTAIGRVAGC